MSDCSARGPGIESRCGQLCLSHNHCDLQPWARAVCTLPAVPRSTQPSTLRGTVNEYQLSGWVIIINGDGGCRCYSCLKQAFSQPKSGGLVWGSTAAWRWSTFIKWTEWTLAMTLWSWWQHYKHCHGYYYYYYSGAILCRHLNTWMQTLNRTRSTTSSQCSWLRRKWVSPLSNLRVFQTILLPSWGQYPMPVPHISTKCPSSWHQSILSVGNRYFVCLQLDHKKAWQSSWVYVADISKES